MAANAKGAKSNGEEVEEVTRYLRRWSGIYEIQKKNHKSCTENVGLRLEYQKQKKKRKKQKKGI